MSDSTTTDPRPAALDAARYTAQAVQDVGAKFMLDMDMYGEVAGLGYQGLGFYIAGRGGVLGDVEHVEVFEAMTFFPAETVQAGWESSASVESRADSAGRFAGYAARWGANNVADGTEGLDRLAELCEKVIQAADGSDAPLFAGWRDLPEPDGEPDLVVHRMNALRELRAARHIAAIRQVGLDPATAFWSARRTWRGSSAGRSRRRLPRRSTRTCGRAPRTSPNGPSLRTWPCSTTTSWPSSAGCPTPCSPPSRRAAKVPEPATRSIGRASYSAGPWTRTASRCWVSRSVSRSAMTLQALATASACNVRG